MLTIRTATMVEAGLIADMSRVTFYETFAAQNTKENMEKFMAEQFSREKLMAEVNEPGNIFLIAFDEEEPVGYARMRESGDSPELGSNAIEIARIYAASNAIGTGIGKALMQKCIDISMSLNKKIIWLGVWEHNLRAIAFYTGFGFKKYGDRVFQLGNDPQTDWLMKKELYPQYR